MVLLFVRRLEMSPELVHARGQSLYFYASQLAQTFLISFEAMGRTETHSEVAVKDQPKRFPAMIASDRLAIRLGMIQVHDICPSSQPVF
jgi:hypothetical protein